MIPLVSWLADALMLLPLWPLLYVVHAIVTAIALRAEPGGFQFAVNHPIASCVMNIVVASSGTLLMNLMLAKPLVEGVVSEEKVLAGVLAWFLVYFSPGDVVHSVCSQAPVKTVFTVLEEVRRSRNVMAGVVTAAPVYPGSLLSQALAGMFKGTGKKWGVTLFRAVSGSHLTSKLELLNISFVTKSGFLLGLVFTLRNYLALGVLRQEECILLGAIFSTAVKLWDMHRDSSHDPFHLPQQRLWTMVARTNTIATLTSSSAKCQDGHEEPAKLGQLDTKRESSDDKHKKD